MSVPHDFDDCLAYSHASSDSPVWERIYRKAFWNFHHMIDYRQNGEHQAAGIDRGVYLSNAKEILIDEKTREKHYGDIALEYTSNDIRGTPGWVCKPLRADYIAYLVMKADICYLLPVPQLQLAWRRHGCDWKTKFKKIVAPNRGYNTLSVGVPVNDLFSSMGNALRITGIVDKANQGAA